MQKSGFTVGCVSQICEYLRISAEAELNQYGTANPAPLTRAIKMKCIFLAPVQLFMDKGTACGQAQIWKAEKQA